jgi:YVTN family beta-propeller protein
MKNSLPAAAMLAILTVGGVLCAQNAPSASLLVLSKRDHSLAIIDPTTRKVLARAPVGDDPHEVIASTDGATAYVSNYGGGSLHTLAVIDLATRKALPSIDLGPLSGPHGLTFVAGKTWFTAEGAKVIGSYDPATRKVDWVLGTGQNRTHMIYVSDDLKRIVTTNVSSGTVSIIEKAAVRGPGGPPPPGFGGPPPPSGPGNLPGPPRMDWNQTLVAVGNGPEGFDVSPGGKEIWVANAQDGTISIIDAATRKVTDTLAANVQGANRLKFTPDGKLVFVSMLGGADLVVLDSGSRQQVKRIPIGHGAAGILMRPDGSQAFVACTPDNYVVVINLHTLEVEGKISDIGEPDGLAWAVRH